MSCDASVEGRRSFVAAEGENRGHYTHLNALPRLVDNKERRARVAGADSVQVGVALPSTEVWVVHASAKLAVINMQAVVSVEAHV